MDGMISQAPVPVPVKMMAAQALLARLTTQVSHERSPQALDRVQQELRRLVEMLDR